MSVFEDDTTLTENPVGMLQELRHLGVEHGAARAPVVDDRPLAHLAHPPELQRVGPECVSGGSWTIYDAIVKDAQNDGIQVMFNPTGYAPLWAQGANPAKYGSHYDPKYAFMPSPNEYKQFVEAVAKEFPAVHTWELYNEPNFGEDLSPQGIDGSRILYSPVMYRALANAGWQALEATGHGHDTILIGATAAHGSVIPARHGTGLPGALRRDHRRCSSCASCTACSPTTRLIAVPPRRLANARRPPPPRRRFRAQNPALFHTSGWSTHPYPLGKDGGLPPTQTNYKGPNYAGFSQLPNLTATLDRIQRVYGSGRRIPVWNTEYGYITNPPNRSENFVSPATQAYYNNWAEYLSWRNSRIASTMQYLLSTPTRPSGTPSAAVSRAGSCTTRCRCRPQAARPTRRAPPNRGSTPTGCRSSSPPARRARPGASRCGAACGPPATRSPTRASRRPC